MSPCSLITFFEPSQIVKSVDILRDQRERSHPFLHLDERFMPRIRTRSGDRPAAFFVPGPDELRIAREGFGRGEIFEAMAAANSRRCRGMSGCRSRRKRPRRSGRRPYLRASTGTTTRSASASGFRKTHQFEAQRVDERVPAGFDHVVRDAHGGPALVHGPTIRRARGPWPPCPSSNRARGPCSPSGGRRRSADRARRGICAGRHRARSRGRCRGGRGAECHLRRDATVAVAWPGLDRSTS